jgi:hypothetical protein
VGANRARGAARGARVGRLYGHREPQSLGVTPRAATTAPGYSCAQLYQSVGAV